MNCPRCAHENNAEQKFCGECGARLVASCPACGATNPQAQKFCGECGGRLGEAATGYVSPQAYTPKHLAERILVSKGAVEGERKQVTVLFADLKGSMELIAERDPEEARKLLDPVLERMMAAVHRFEGTVNQVMGDGIMALFGAPLALEDHAVRACYAALAMQEAVKAYSEQVRTIEGVDVAIRVGLNSGDVVVRSIGSDLRMDYSAIGQTTHLAARMEQLALPGSIRITLDTLRLAESFVQAKPLGAIPVKGLAAPINVFELTGAANIRTRMQAAAARGLTHFVGRQIETDTLARALRRAADGSGQVMAVVGEPGVGKSRLYWEFTRSHRIQGWLLLESGSVSYGKANIYQPLIELLKTYFQIEDRDDLRRVREKVVGRLLSLDRALEADLPALLSLLNVSVEEGVWQSLDPPQRRQRTLEACKRLLLRESQVQPLLIVFEDLHWIDSETQAFLDSMVDSLPSARLLLLVNYRPEYQHRWALKSCYTQLRVDPLAQESAQELLAHLLGTEAALAPLKRMLLGQTDGNPFFLEESVRTLMEEGTLAGSRGACQLVRPLDTVRVPDTVQAVLAARIDRLGIDDKRLLQTAAVIGKDIPLPILQAVADVPVELLTQQLSNLQSAEFLYESRLFPDPEYTFKHALTHEVAYANLLQEQRRTLHARIVQAIETTYNDRLEEHIEQLAHHALRGQLWRSSVSYLRLAAEKAAARSALRAASHFLEEALDVLAQIPEDRDTTEQAIDLRFRLRTVLVPLAEFGNIVKRLEEAETLARAIGDEDRLGWVSCYFAHYYSVSLDPGRAIAHIDRATSIAESHGDFALLVATRFFGGGAYIGLGNYQQARRLLTLNIDAITPEQEREHFRIAGPAAAWTRNMLTRCFAETGHFSEALVHGKEALRIGMEANHSYALAGAYLSLGYLELRRGDLNSAASWLEKGAELCQARDLPWHLPVIRVALACAYALSERLAESRLLCMTDGGAALAGYGNVSEAGLFLVEVYLQSGDWDAASRLARDMLEFARKYKTKGREAWALHYIGRIAAADPEGDAVAAECAFRESLTLATAQGMHTLEALCRLGLGKLFAATNEVDLAQEQFGIAVGTMREMGMVSWLREAEAALVASRA